MAFLPEVEALAANGAGSLMVVPQDELGVPDLDAVLTGADDETLVYCCGPEGLLTAVEERCNSTLPNRLRLERFGAGPEIAARAAERSSHDGDPAASAFEVELRRSSTVVQVQPGRTVLEAVRDVLPDVMYSCEEGYCGSCEAVVLEGRPEHRDDVLSEAEHAANKTMMMCVSRSLDERLVLDL